MTAEDQPGAGRTTIVDVARAAGVSVATVSKVLNERDGVAGATRARVLAAIETLGYESSIVASSLRRKRTGLIGVLVPEFEPYSAEVLKGISYALGDTGHELLAHAGSTDQHLRTGWEKRSLSRLSRTLIDGAIVVAPTTVITDQVGIPIVAIDPHTGTHGPATVDSDNVGGARLATEHLLALGHRRIAYLGGRPDLLSAQLREQGFREALADVRLTPDPALMKVGGYDPRLAEAPARELLGLPRHARPTAVFAANDISAIRVRQVAEELGLRVPEDLSIIGYDDVPDALSSTPPLSTVAQPLLDMGGTALRMLLAMLAGRETERHVRLPTALVARASTAPPAG